MNIDNLMALPSDVRLSLIDQEIFDPKDVQLLIDSGKLDIDELEAVNLIMAKINLNKLKHAVLAVHPYKITPPLPHVKRPRFVTYIPIEDSQHRSTRKKIAKSSEEALYSFLFN